MLILQAYIPVSNKCRDLEQALGKNDLTYLQEGKVDGCWDKSNFPFVMVDILCMLLAFDVISVNCRPTFVVTTVKLITKPVSAFVMMGGCPPLLIKISTSQVCPSITCAVSK